MSAIKKYKRRFKLYLFRNIDYNNFLGYSLYEPAVCILYRNEIISASQLRTGSLKLPADESWFQLLLK